MRVCLCAHMVLKLCLPCGFLCCFLHERPRLPELAPLRTHLRRRMNVEVRPPVLSPAQTHRFGALDGRNFPLPPPLLLTPLLPAEEEWVRTPPNFTCYTTFVFIACFVCVSVLCTTCLPTDSDFILFSYLAVTQILYTQHPGNIQRTKST